MADNENTFRFGHAYISPRVKVNIPTPILATYFTSPNGNSHSLKNPDR